MTTREENAFKLAFDQATEMANERPLPSWQPRTGDEELPDSSAPVVAIERPAHGAAIAALAAPGPQRNPRTQWLVAAAIALALVLGVAGLVARFAPTAQQATNPTVSPSQRVPSATPSARPAPQVTTPNLDSTPCFRVPGFEGNGPNANGAFPAKVDRIWLCGQGYDDKPLEGKDATDLLTRLKALPAPSGKDDGLGSCYVPDGNLVQFFINGDDELHGYMMQPSACGAFDGVSITLLVKEIQNTVKKVHGAPTPTATSDDPCAITNPRFAYYERQDISKAMVCTDINGAVIKPTRPIEGQALNAIRELYGTDSCNATAPPTVAAMAIRVTDGKNLSVWYLTGTQISRDGECAWTLDAATLQALRELGAPGSTEPEQRQTAQSSPVSPLATPCGRYPNLDNTRGLLKTVDKIWLCGEGWDLRPLVGADAAAVLERIKSRANEKADGDHCSVSGNLADVYMDSGTERRGYFLVPPCTIVGGVSSDVIYDEIRTALFLVNGPPSEANPSDDVCGVIDVPMGDPDDMRTPTGSVCSDATGKPLAQGRPIDGKLLEQLLKGEGDRQTTTPDTSSFIVIRLSSLGDCPGPNCGQRNYRTMFLIGNQLWSAGFYSPFAQAVDAGTAAKIRQLAGQ